jgi:septal ring factor EnvC (AmiA/AmiB activator)
MFFSFYLSFQKDPFSELVIKLSKRCEDVNRNMMVLKDQMSTLKCNLKSQTERAETFSQTANKLSVDSKKSNDIIDNNHDELKKLKGKIQGLEKELVSKDFKLSKIVGAYQQMMQ